MSSKKELMNQLRRRVKYLECSWDMRFDDPLKDDSEHMEELQELPENKPLFLLDEKYSVYDVIEYYKFYNEKIAGACGNVTLKALDRNADRNVSFQFNIKDPLPEKISLIINDRDNIVLFEEDKIFYRKYSDKNFKWEKKDIKIYYYAKCY